MVLIWIISRTLGTCSIPIIIISRCIPINVSFIIKFSFSSKQNVAEVLNLKSSADQEVLKYFRDRAVGSVNYIDPIPSNYFKLGSVATVDEEEMVITVKAVESLPVGNIGDGVAVNVKAARALRDLCSFELPGMALFYFPNCFSLVQ